VSEKMFSREQYEQLRSFPEISRDELSRYFTLTPAEVAFVDPGAGRGSADRLGLAVQLPTFPRTNLPDEVRPLVTVRRSPECGAGRYLLITTLSALCFPASAKVS